MNMRVSWMDAERSALLILIPLRPLCMVNSLPISGLEGVMRTNLVIDRDLLLQAMKAAGSSTNESGG